jgi:copper ion binding protein
LIEAKYEVPDMSCVHCKSSIEESLREVSGVRKAKADPDSKVVEVEYDEGQVGEEAVKAAIEDAGYSVVD